MLANKKSKVKCLSALNLSWIHGFYNNLAQVLTLMKQCVTRHNNICVITGVVSHSVQRSKLVKTLTSLHMDVFCRHRLQSARYGCLLRGVCYRSYLLASVSTSLACPGLNVIMGWQILLYPSTNVYLVKTEWRTQKWFDNPQGEVKVGKVGKRSK